MLLLLLAAGRGGATLILVYVRPGEAFVASDSAVSSLNGQRLPQRSCKVHIVSPGLTVAVSGLLRWPPEFDAVQMARVAAREGNKLSEAAIAYGQAVVRVIERIWKAHRPDFLRVAGQTDAGRPVLTLHSFCFIGRDADGRLRAASFDVDVESRGYEVRLRPIEPPPLDELGPEALLAVGHRSTLLQAPEIFRMVHRQGVPAALVWAIEREAVAMPSVVGGPVAVLRISDEGGQQWLMPGVCGERSSPLGRLGKAMP